VPSTAGHPDTLAPDADGPDVTFVRVASVVLGGEFDGLDNEEIEVRVVLDGKSARMAYQVLDLPSGGKTEEFGLASSDWVELPEQSAWDLGVHVREEDAPNWEEVTHSKAPIHVERSALALGKKVQLQVPLCDYTLEEGALIFSTKVRVENVSAVLEIIRAKRVDAPDALSRRAVQGVYDQLTKTLPGTPSELRGLSYRLEELAKIGRVTGGTSLNHRVRRVLCDLALMTREAATCAAEMGALDLVEMDAQRKHALEEVGNFAQGEEEAATRAAATAALHPVELTPKALDAQIAELRALEADLDVRNGKHPNPPLASTVSSFKQRLELARRALDGGKERLAKAWTELHESIEQESK
jgi:hypothetical protein